MNTKITKYAVGHALLTMLYIVLISSFLFYVPRTFNFDKTDTVFAPILMLSLLVFSASVVGSLIFARPILWCLDGQKKEAVRLLVYTLLAFFIITAAISVVFFTKSV
ncbi:MAG: hypothetical protein WAP55_03135 [Minisyncoccia bacterium]